ncbi:protein rolling stone [Scaptodrosophila lebanonensis]|uniref:Protein rolling stone n=1 Tax=Drosophila lebanonensis TaxID=7225 RepID=A0A6J2TME0_DROLE|nr:protein rolling stone [Scaptodrosophila lebanonensis]
MSGGGGGGGGSVEPNRGTAVQVQSFWQEFRWQNCGLQHSNPKDFARSQWQREDKCRWYLIYRWLLALFFNTGVVTCIAKYFWRGRWFLYLTNWAFLLCGFTSAFGAVIVSLFQRSPEKLVTRTGLLKIYWASYWTNLVVANVVGLVYWSCIYPRDRSLANITRVDNAYNLWTHALPSLIFGLDLMLVAFPARLMHFIYPLSLALAYASFTYIYYISGGLDPRGRHYLYNIMDWERPRLALLSTTLISMLFVVCSTLQFGMYRIRRYLAFKITKLE